MTSATTTTRPSRLRLETLSPLILAAASFVAYGNSLDGAFVFDDHRYIVNNPRIAEPGDLGRVLSGRRPTLDLSLALNRAIGGTEPSGYHAVNILIHVLATITLYGLIRRTTARGAADAAAAHSGTGLALVVALFWTLHPLQSQCVNYIVQRSESLMVLFYLLTLYALLRAVESARPMRWYAAGVAACILGMGSKGVMVTAPILALIYDRVFLAGSFRELLRRRWGFHVALLATWGVLVTSGVAPGVLSPNKAVATAGFSVKDITPVEYLTTQGGVLLHYLRLSVLPWGLCLDPGWPVARDFTAALPANLVVIALLGLTAWTLWRRPRLGFVAAAFFIVLAPTSSVVPLKDPAFEHRMYLPLASVLIIAVLIAEVLWRKLSERYSIGTEKSRKIAAAAVVVLAVVLGTGTIVRNNAYSDELTIWRDVVAKRPESFRGRYNLGRRLMEDRLNDEAVRELTEAVRIRPDDHGGHYNLGKALAFAGRSDEAVAQFAEAVRIKPDFAAALSDLGNALARSGHYDEAIERYREAIRVRPEYAPTYFNLGSVLLGLGRLDEAVEALREAARLTPDEARVHFALGMALRRQGRPAEAADAFRRTLQLDPAHARARQALGETAAP